MPNSFAEEFSWTASLLDPPYEGYLVKMEGFQSKRDAVAFVDGLDDR